MPYQKRFKIFNFALAIWCFSGILVSGEVSLFTSIIGFILVLLALLQIKILKNIPDIFWTILTLICFIISFFYATNYSFLDALIFFFIFLLGTKLFNLRKNRDYFQLYVISFFIIVLSSILTASILFVIVYIGYIFLLIGSLILFNAKCDYDLTNRIARDRNIQVQSISVLREKYWGLRIFSIISVGVIILTGFFFAFLPRFSTQIFKGIAGLKVNRSSGFTDEVSFMSAGEIQNDTTIVMRIQPQFLSNFDIIQNTPFYARATSLDKFSGKRWTKSRFSKAYSSIVKANQFEINPQFYKSNKKFSQKFYLEASRQGYFYGAIHPYVYNLDSRQHVEVDNEAGSIKLLHSLEIPLAYKVISLLEPTTKSDPLLLPTYYINKISTPNLFYLFMEKNVNSVGSIFKDFYKSIQLKKYPLYDTTKNIRRNSDNSFRDYENFRRRLRDTLYLQLPDSVDRERYGNLVKKITENKLTTFQKSISIETFLKSNYFYSLSGINETANNPLDSFLFEKKEGHCEYFASAMVILLRSLNIPSRIVLGFCTDEWNSYGRYFTVREQNAHTWVEVWFDNYGWMTFDPTPPYGIGLARFKKSSLATLYHIFDSLKFYWYRYVLDYSFEDQVALRRFLIQFSSLLHSNMSENISNFIKSFGFPTNQNHSVNIKVVILFILLIIISVFILFLLLNEIKGFGNKRKMKLKLRYRSLKVSIQFLREFLSILKKKGFYKLPSETLLEFIKRVIKEKPDLNNLTYLIYVYYKTRFNNEPVTLEEKEKIKNILTELKLA